MAGDDRLATLVRSLPAELFNAIYDLTFSPRCPAINIETFYRPPSELQVDRATRATFAKQYYSDTVFIASAIDVVAHWLRHLRGNHIKFLQDVRLLLIVEDSRAPHLENAARWLAETVCSTREYGHSEIQRQDCTFLRVHEEKTERPSVPVYEV